MALKRIRATTIATVFALALTGGAAVAQVSSPDVNSVADRMNRLEADLQDLQRQVYQGSVTLGNRPANTGGATTTAAASGDPSLARLTVRMDELERLMQNLTNQIESVSFQVRQLQTEYQKYSEDTDFRLQALEGGNPMAPMTKAPEADTAPSPSAAASSQPGSARLQSATNDQMAALSSGDPQEQYDAALTALQQGDHNQAERSLRQFLDQHEDSELAGNANYWLAETFYVRGQYGDAARIFLEGVKAYPKSPKAPDSLLKLGMSLSAMGNGKEACRTLSEIPKRYPDASPTVKQRTKAEMSRNKC